MNRLAILIGGHLATAPRPQKEAATAVARGSEVVILCNWWSRSLAQEDLELASAIGARLQPVTDLRERTFRSNLIRLRQRTARELFSRMGVATGRCFGVGAPEMLREVLRISPDITMVHSEAGLWVGKQLLKRGYRVGVDFEDWFSEDLPEHDRKGRPVSQLKELERCLLRKAHLTLATTNVMAEALALDAGTDRIPVAMPNSFPAKEAPSCSSNADHRRPEAVSFYWFSQTIGPGRGLESVAKALMELQGDWELHLRGNLRGYDSWFEAHFPQQIRNKVKILAPVPNRELARHSASHDVGLALEVPHCPSRELTATNKIFEYLRCGLAVIASSTRGQLEVMKNCPEAGWIVPPDDIRMLADVMQRCLDNRAELYLARFAARKGGMDLAWENYSDALGNAILAASQAHE